MSQRPIVRSDDLRRLRGDGFNLRIAGGKLVVGDVPFVDRDSVVHDNGALVMPLTLAGDATAPPSDHTAHFVGGVPCDTSGQPLNKILNNIAEADLGDGLVAQCFFSAKPVGTGKYNDFYDKVTTYVAHISSPARALNPEATARRYRPIAASEDDPGPFRYLNTASSRAGIDAITACLEPERVAIVGLGGTGTYLLDLIAKTPVAEIHLFDDDAFLSHNAFRSPGAASLDQLDATPLKVNHFASLYDNLRTGIVAHPCRVTESNIAELETMTFVFIAVDDAPAKEPIITGLIDRQIPFIDVGMGVEEVDGRLTGIVRTTTATPNYHDHVRTRVATTERAVDDEYRTNIQIAELNAYNACVAVIRWKKYRDFYADLGGEHHTIYSIPTNHVVNEDVR